MNRSEFYFRKKLQQKRKGTKTFVHLCKRVTQNPVNMFNPQILREDF